MLPVIVRYTEQARAAVEHDADPELARLGERFAALLDFVERFDRGCEIFVRGDARAIEGLFATLDRLEPQTVDRLWRRVGDLGPDDLVRALEALAKLPPSGRAPASARSLLPRAVVLEDRYAGGDRGRGAAAQRRRKGPWNGDRLAMASTSSRVPAIPSSSKRRPNLARRLSAISPAASAGKVQS